jgi:glycosyltransferase involved in cell wall biosynthesis
VEVPLRSDGRLGTRLRRHVPDRIRSSLLARRLVNAVRDHAREVPSNDVDLTLYPFPGVPVRARPAVVVLHDLRRFQPEFRQPGYEAVIRQNVSTAAAVTVSWPHPFQQALAMFRGAEGKIAMVPPPVFHSRPSGTVTRPETGLLVYPSSTASHKNHATLLEAMALLPEYRLVCPGPLVEPQAASLLARAAQPDIAGRVSFPGFVPVPELEALYARASIVIVPSTWEAASGAIFEAFSWGLPVACADVEPLREQVAFAGADACFFGPYDARSLAQAVRIVAADRERYAAASREGGRRMSQRTWADTARDYAEVFDWVANGGSGPIPQRLFASGAPFSRVPS